MCGLHGDQGQSRDRTRDGPTWLLSCESLVDLGRGFGIALPLSFFLFLFKNMIKVIGPVGKKKLSTFSRDSHILWGPNYSKERFVLRKITVLWRQAHLASFSMKCSLGHEPGTLH